MPPIDIPLSVGADKAITRLARITGAPAIAALDGMTLLGERAMLMGLAIPGRRSAGGGCRLLDAIGGVVALNLVRPADRELLPALFESADFDPGDDAAIAALVGRYDGAALVQRGRMMGLAIAFENERLKLFGSKCPSPLGEGLGWGLSSPPALVSVRPRGPTPPPPLKGRGLSIGAPRVLDLSALWAGPLAAHLLWLAGADVVKVESKSRPDAMRDGETAFYDLLNQGKASVAIDFTDPADRAALLALIAASDIVIEAARPRALAQLGIDAAAIVRATPGLVWITITAHGAEGEAADWVGFGDDCGVAAGLSVALRSATGRTGFVGDAIADPLTGIHAALTAWEGWAGGEGGRYGVAMSHVVARHLDDARASDPAALTASLREWSAAAGRPFPTVARRPAIPARLFGADTHSRLSAVPTC